LGFARKDLLLIHEKGKSPINGSGRRAVSSEGGQGLNQSGRSTTEPNLEQNQSNFPKSSETGYRTGPKPSLETSSETGFRTRSETSSRTGPGADTLGDWVTAMQDELHKFERNKVCHLVSRPEDISIIDTKWVFKNRLDKLRTVSRNQAKLVVQR